MWFIGRVKFTSQDLDHLVLFQKKAHMDFHVFNDLDT